MKTLVKVKERNIDFRMKQNMQCSYNYGCPEKCPREKSPPGKSPRENWPPENYPTEICPPGKLPLGKMPHQVNGPPENCPPKNCFTRFLLLLTLSYSCSFSNLL